jgi:phage-related protein
MAENLKITKINDFDDVINNINGSINRIRNLFDEEEKSVNIFLENPHAWSGNAKDSAGEKYAELSSTHPTIIESLDNFINFLVNTSSNYKLLNESILSDIENKIDNLDVNS